MVRRDENYIMMIIQALPNSIWDMGRDFITKQFSLYPRAEPLHLLCSWHPHTELWHTSNAIEPGQLRKNKDNNQYHFQKLCLPTYACVVSVNGNSCECDCGYGRSDDGCDICDDWNRRVILTTTLHGGGDANERCLECYSHAHESVYPRDCNIFTLRTSIHSKAIYNKP